MQHPDLMSHIAQLQYQDRLREAARQQRAGYIGQLLQSLIAAAKRYLQAHPHPKRGKPDLAPRY